jgi:hypothetical protein
MVKIELVTPQRHYIVTNQSTCLEGIIELIIRSVEALISMKGGLVEKEKVI